MCYRMICINNSTCIIFSFVYPTFIQFLLRFAEFGLTARNRRTRQGVYPLLGQSMLLLQAGVIARATFPMTSFLPLTSLPSSPLRTYNSSLIASIQNISLVSFIPLDPAAFVDTAIFTMGETSSHSILSRSLVEKFACQKICRIPLEAKMALL